MSFREERECRVFYRCDWCDDEVTDKERDLMIGGWAHVPGVNMDFCPRDRCKAIAHWLNTGEKRGWLYTDTWREYLRSFKKEGGSGG